MERQKNIGLTPRIAIIIIMLFHVVGLVGLALPQTRSLFLHIVPWHIMLMLAVILVTHDYIDERFLLFAVLIFTSGFALEWLGVHKYWLFGDYNYGKTLGIKLFDIPLAIGVNWFLLIYAAGVTMQRSRLKSAFFRVICGAVMLVLLDVLIEPVAIRFDYWAWEEGFVPLKNYICWFAASAGMLYIFELFRFKKQSVAGPVLLATQFLFFGVLNLLALL